MPWTIYHSTDVGAPVLTTTAGSLVALLDACLVDGYGAKSAAGWVKPFTGTNKAVYQPGPGAVSRKYFRVNDAAAGTSGANEALIRGFDSMSDIDTGTTPFPADAQSALTQDSLVIRKASSAEWIVAADERTCILFIRADATGFYGTYFGEYYSYRNDDVHGCALIARPFENSSSVKGEQFAWLFPPESNASTVTKYGMTYLASAVSTYVWGCFAAGWTLGASSVPIALSGGAMCNGINQDQYGATRTEFFNGWQNVPAAFSGRLFLNRPSLIGYNGGVYGLMGHLRGVFIPQHYSAQWNVGDVIEGAGELAGKSFLCVKQVFAGNLDSVLPATHISGTVLIGSTTPEANS